MSMADRMAGLVGLRGGCGSNSAAEDATTGGAGNGPTMFRDQDLGHQKQYPQSERPLEPLDPLARTACLQQRPGQGAQSLFVQILDGLSVAAAGRSRLRRLRPGGEGPR